MTATLQQLFEKYGSDKARHGYAQVYQTLGAPRCMLEVGVWKGASVRAWREWWPEAQVHGLDVWTRTPPPVLPNLHRGDSRTWRPALTAGFDLIIDDGSHRPADQAATLRNLWPVLASGGVYFIEDCFPVDQWLGRESAMPEYFRQRSDSYSFADWIDLGHAIVASKGRLKRHDFRAHSGRPDSVLLEIRK